MACVEVLIKQPFTIFNECRRLLNLAGAVYRYLSEDVETVEEVRQPTDDTLLAAQVAVRPRIEAGACWQHLWAA